MLPELLVHAVLQLAIVSVYFWTYLIPSIKNTVNDVLVSMTTDPIKGVMESNCAFNSFVKAQLSEKKGIFMDSDPVMTRTNNILLAANCIVALLLLMLIFSIVKAYYWDHQLRFAVIEVVMTYVVVIAFQVWFMSIITKYVAFTENDLLSLVQKGTEKYCLYGSNASKDS